MKKNVFNIFQSLGLTAEQIKKMTEQIRELQFAKGETVFSQGETVKNVYILHRGLIKLSYLTAEGKELIKSFISEGDLFGSLVSQLSDGGSTFSAICLEETDVIVIPYTVFESVVEQNPTAKKFALTFFKQLALKKEIREYEFLCLSAEARYRKFLDEYPKLFGRIAQQDIARYLGITPIALSRIKNR